MDCIKVNEIEGEDITIKIYSRWSIYKQLLGYRDNDLTTLIIATGGLGRYIHTDFIQNEW